MAYRNKIITNSKTGQMLRFIRTGKETNEQLLEMEATFNPHSKEPAEHYHPFQKEEFTVLKGELTVKIQRQVKILKKGDVLHIPVNTAHAMWNNSNATTVINWKVQPALNTENFLETVTGLANDGETNKDGMPAIWQIVVLSRLYSDSFRLTKPPYWLQKIIFTILAPFSYIFGYRASDHQKYID